MNQPIKNAFLLLMLIGIAACSLSVITPSALLQQLPAVTSHISPIGFRPMSGSLSGRAILANPFSACEIIQNLHDDSDHLFVLADDTDCLQSVKAKNAAASGAYAVIVRQNINNTLHDKESGLIHIPLIEVSPAHFDTIVEYMRNNPKIPVGLMIDFVDNSRTHPVNVEAWFSPTETAIYEFLLRQQYFLTSQPDQLGFTPHYVLQSQQDGTRYPGCLSSGAYCPVQIDFEGQYQGVKIVEEALRQIVIWGYGKELWWKYIKYYYNSCLRDKTVEEVWSTGREIENCGDNAAIMAGISPATLARDINASYLGPKKEVDDNTYLLQERQYYLRQQVDKHPVLLVNKKEHPLQTLTFEYRVCNLQGALPSETCQTLTAPVNSFEWSHFFMYSFIALAVMIGLMLLYKVYMHYRMKNEIKQEVDSTLQQYYRYMETFEGENGQTGKKEKKRMIPVKQTSQMKEPEERKGNKKTGHQVLVEEEEEKKPAEIEMEEFGEYTQQTR